MKLRFLFFPALAAVTTPAAEPHGDFTPEQLAFFEKNIRPVLISKCYDCHSASAKKLKGGLVLDTREGTLMGGESGHPGVVPGDPTSSSIYEALLWTNDDMQMPPKERLPADVVANFKKWIEMGAPDPRQSTGAPAAGKRTINIDEGRKHWAFTKPVKASPPPIKDENWANNDIDRWIMASLEKNQLQPAPDADRVTLIRRLALDLTGLPPTPDEVKAFLADTAPDAIKSVVEMYLDSERYGERWGRHWLDVARYAESSGKDVNLLYPQAWRYRDYVIESFKKDKPYDLFLKEQIAGDLMKSRDKRDQAEKIVATGFLAIGSKGHNTRERRQFVVDVVDEQIDTVSQAMLGVTLACARCHDHKFDPFTQRDYYAMAGIFMSSETLYGTHAQLQNNNPSTLIELEEDAGLPAGLAKISTAEVAILKQRKTQAETTANEATQELRSMARSGNAVDRALRTRILRDQAAARSSDLELFNDDGTPRTLVMGMLDRESPINSPILTRGELSQPGEVVPRGLTEVLCAKGEPLNISEGSGRLDLAYWIASKDNPLTARVMANRVWLKLFGKALVETPDNFGAMGAKPTHPELLDYLAVRFMENGWSIKSLIKEIVMSRAYQMSSTAVPANLEKDPDNRLVWRMNQRRLDAEALRDSMLAVAGVLDLYPVAGSPVARAGEGREGLLNLLREVSSNAQNYRSIFLPILRDQIPEVLALFDYPDASLVTGDRDSTNVPSQSLYLMNNPQVIGLADSFARRVGGMEGTDQEKLAAAFTLAYGRAPTAAEGQAAREFFTRFITEQMKGKGSPNAKKEAQNKALSAFCQGLLASAEFRYLK
ncbi:MAG: PSD1 domain-containing protein [Verrucomicrobiaceae bacterium]|nr:PSD1 domain-containing protein [Verrucomicrobiaceae bacterium]